MSASGEAVLLEVRDRVLWLTINRPDRRNAMNDAVIACIAQGFARAEADPEIRAIVLTGAGERAFCAGADLAPDAKSFRVDAARTSNAYADLLRQAIAGTTPSIARVNGHCMAGGMGLLAMCDMAVAREDAVFGLPEVKVGIFPMQVLSVLQRLVPRRKLAELCITGEPVSAAEALELGLVNHVVPAGELDARTEWLLARILDKSPTAIRHGKYAMRAIADMTFEQTTAYTESQIRTLAMTEDAQEGMRAFAEKRPPQWPGR